VVFVTDAAATAGKILLLRQQRLLILVPIGLSIHDTPARCLLTLEADVGRRHGVPPSVFDRERRVYHRGGRCLLTSLSPVQSQRSGMIDGARSETPRFFVLMPNRLLGLTPSGNA
jgi:hypothetical protein